MQLLCAFCYMKANVTYCNKNLFYNTYSAMSRYPQDAAAWRGIQPSLSGWLMLAPFSTRKVTMSTLSSMHACGRRGRQGVRFRSVCARMYPTSCQWHITVSMKRALHTVTACRMLPELLRNVGSCGAPKKPAHSRGA